MMRPALSKHFAIPLLLAALLGLQLGARPAAGQVTIETFDTPIDLAASRAGAAFREQGRAEAPAAGVAERPTLAPRRSSPAYTAWFIPHYRVDQTAFADTTLWAVRNETGGSIELLAEYFREDGVLEANPIVSVPVHGVHTANVRDVPGLSFDTSEGYIRLTPTGAISADYFQVDTSRDLAVGGVAVTPADFCQSWSARFASFSPGSNSVLTFLFNNPQGNDPADPYTVEGNVYNEAGDFLGSFALRTRFFTAQIPVTNLTFGSSFGSMEFIINGLSGGHASVAHNAEGRFSVGMEGICTDP